MFDTAKMAAAEPVVVDPVSKQDQRARLRLVAERVAPLALAREQTLPVLPALTGLFPDGALRRGSVVAVDGVGATSLALALVAGPSASGSWTAVVGDPGLGLCAAAEAGVVLERLLVINPPDQKAGIGAVAALVGSVDIVMVGAAVPIRPPDLRRLSARLRERGSVLIRVGPVDAPGVDISLRIVSSQWAGLGAGHGLLQTRRVAVQTQGRGAAARPRAADLLLPAPGGGVELQAP